MSILANAWRIVARLRLCFLGVSLICFVWVDSARAQSTTSEYQLKAEYLAKVFDFVQWPEGSSSKRSVQICVLGDYSFGTVLSQEAARAILTGRRIKVSWVRKEKDLNGCDVIFVSYSEERRYEQILQTLQGGNALTVGETEGFLNAGGMVALSYQRERLQFDVNLDATRAAQLKIDSRLLSMARHVIRERYQPGA